MSDALWGFVGTIVGGALAILGGYLQSVRAGRTRMAEIVAERKVDANGEAYARIKKVSGMLQQASDEDTMREVLKHEEWLFARRLFLPGQFPDYWLAVRTGIQQLRILEQDTAHQKEEYAKRKMHLIELAGKATDEIYEDAGIRPIEVISTRPKDPPQG